MTHQLNRQFERVKPKYARQCVDCLLGGWSALRATFDLADGPQVAPGPRGQLALRPAAVQSPPRDRMVGVGRDAGPAGQSGNTLFRSHESSVSARHVEIKQNDSES